MTVAPNVGCHALAVHDDVQGAAIPAWLLYPTRDPAGASRFGPYSVDVAVDGAPAGEGMPLVVVSHGTGGTPWGYRDLAASLAREGFVVALVEHPGNSRNGDQLAGTVANLENRPRHVARVIDAAYADALVGPAIAHGPVGMIGHSMGGYTALAVAGGKPSSMPHESGDGAGRPVAITHDQRVRAVVLLAPALPWFLLDGALAGVDVPILLRTAEHDPYTPPFNGELVARGVPDPARVDARVVPGAGHFAFMSPFPPPMVRPDFLPSQDPHGFDRAAYQPVLHAEVLAFLRRHLAP
jgi:predicted dienelactone hydrolase